MLDFMMNNKEYEYSSDGNLAAILAQFNSEYVMHVVSDTLEIQFNSFDTIPKPNAVKAYKMVFNELYNQYQIDKDQILDVEIDLYNNIISIIGTKYGFQFINPEVTDIYTLALYVYDFFVSKFNTYLVNFYSRYIFDQKETIATNLDMAQLKQIKDVSSSYGKISFGDDNPLWAITAMLPTVLEQLRYLEIPDGVIYKYAYGENQAGIDLLMSHINPNTSIFNTYNSILFNDYMYSSVATQIRMKIQQDHAEMLSPKNILVAEK